MLTILLLLLLIPLFLTIFCQKMQLEELLGNVNRTAEKEEDADMLFCIVAKEISADAPEECIKAQCVIARTNLKAAEETGTELPGRMTMGELQELWGDYFSEAEGKIKEAIQETDGETCRTCCIPCSECGQYKKYGRIISGFGYAISFRCGML